MRSSKCSCRSGQIRVSALESVGKLVFYGFMEPAHFIMQEGMFRGLKERLRRASTTRSDELEEATEAVGRAIAGTI